jgi:hypothetical protein
MDSFPTFPLLDNWYIAQTVANTKDTISEHTSKVIIIGNVYNHSSFKDGELIKTAPVKKVDLERGLISTADKTYTLGSPQPQWVEWLHETKEDVEINKFLARFDLKN